MKKGKHDFLDPEEKHTLSEMECELIAFFRALSAPRKRVVMQMLFADAMDNKKLS